MNEALRFGLIGCGGIGELRAKALQHIRIMRLTAVSDVDVNRAKALAQQHQAAAETDWRQLVRRDDVDAIIVATPHSLHAEMTIAALEAGKHVLCEKPLACTPVQGRAMVEAAQSFGRHLATGFNYRYFPPIRKARALLDSGLIGPLDHVRAYGGYSAADLGQAWVRDAGISGGGALHDIGIHLLDLTCYFLGAVAEVKGFASSSVWKHPGCEDNAFVVLRSPTGQIASVGASWSEWRGYYFGLELHGTRGCIEATCFPMATRVTWADERGGKTKRRRHLFPVTRVREKLLSYRAVVVDTFVDELRDFAQATRGKQGSAATGTDGLLALEIAHVVCQGQDAEFHRVATV